MTLGAHNQGCARDVGARDRDETETFANMGRDESRRDLSAKVARPRRDRDIYQHGSRRDETRRDVGVKVARPRRDRDIC